MIRQASMETILFVCVSIILIMGGGVVLAFLLTGVESWIERRRKK